MMEARECGERDYCEVGASGGRPKHEHGDGRRRPRVWLVDTVDITD